MGEVQLPTVLIVDDERTNRRLLSVFLFKQYTTLAAKSGEEAIEILRAKKEDQTLDEICAILLDVMMPDMDGFQLLAKIRESCGPIPVIMCTALNDQASVVKAIQLGANDFLLKPFRQKVLLEKLAKFDPTPRELGLA